MTRHWRKILIVTAAAAVLAGIADYLAHRYDPTRILYKRLKAADAYVYDEIHPRFLQTDPGSLIRIRSPADMKALRQRLVHVIWGEAGFPDAVRPARVESDFADAELGRLPNLSRIDRLTVDMGNDVKSHLYLLQPKSRRKTRLVIYHHGFAGSFREVPEVIGAFLRRGFPVLGMNLMAYGGNSGKYRTNLGKSYNLHFDLDKIPTPLRYHLEPVAAGINHALREAGIDSVAMIGFSAGGFVAALAAAVDPRIERSYPVAGVLPIYLREGPEIQHGMASYYPPLLAAASYLDLFILGSAGPGRGQLQVFNRYDRCCYNNVKATLYEPSVAKRAEALGGAFAVLIDETHADHRFSEFAVNAVLADLARR